MDQDQEIVDVQGKTDRKQTCELKRTGEIRQYFSVQGKTVQLNGDHPWWDGKKTVITQWIGT